MEVEPYLPFRGKKGFGGSFTSLDSDEGPKVNQNTRQFSDACAAMGRPSPAREDLRFRRFEKGEMRTRRRLALQCWEEVQ
jgi:hypothetical protein